MSDYNLGICKIIFSPWFSVYWEYVIIVDYLYKFSKQLLVLLCKTLLKLTPGMSVTLDTQLKQKVMEK